ncbi:unnamed protein product [Urochloa humidicola]
MKLLQALYPLVFLLACFTSNASVLQDACKSFAAKHPEIGYDYCIKFFQADKGSAAAADKRGLAAIAVKITGAASKSTKKRIAALKASETDKRRLECLSSCAEAYSDALSEIAVAAAGIASGTAGGLGDAVTALSAVLDAPSTCEEGFVDLNVPSPLAAEDAEFGKEASIALDVTAAL